MQFEELPGVLWTETSGGAESRAGPAEGPHGTSG